MGTECLTREEEQSETKNLVCCLQFLAKEATDSQLPIVSKLIHDAISQINDLQDHRAPCDMEKNFSELVCAFKTFVKFYLLGNPIAYSELIALINNMDRGRLQSYVH